MEATNGGNSTTTVEASLAAIERRLANVETIGRRWRAAAMLLAVGMVCVVGMGADEGFPGKVVTANAFMVANEKGEAVAAFGYLAKGDDPCLRLLARDGKSTTVIVPGLDAIKVIKKDGTVKWIE